MSLENAANIPKEELVALCMKMNKRMQMMETKGKELVKRKGTLLYERRKLLELVNTVLPQDLGQEPKLNPADDADLDLELVGTRWTAAEQQRAGVLIDAQQRLEDAEQRLHHSSSGSEKLGKQAVSAELPGGTESGETQAEAVTQLRAECDRSNRELSDERVHSKKLDAEVTRLQKIETHLKTQARQMEVAIIEKTTKLGELAKQLEADKAAYEEKVVSIQMTAASAAQTASASAAREGDEAKEREMAALRQQLESAQSQIAALKTAQEEADMSVANNRDMISALQSRLIEVEPELMQAREKLKRMESEKTASALLRAEHQAEFNKLSKDLKRAFAVNEETAKALAELEEYKANAEGKLIKLVTMTEQVTVLQSAVDDKTSLISRLRTEAQTAERNHAMRTGRWL